LIAAFLAAGAAKSFFLSSATFFWALSWAFNAFFLSGNVAEAILALMAAILFASTFLVTTCTFLVAFLSTTLAFTILALIAAFWAGGADLRAFLRATIFLAILSWAFKAAFLWGLLAAASFFLISAILDLSYLWNFALAVAFLTWALALANLAFAAFNNFFKAALAFGVLANVNFFLNAATFLRCLSWRFNAFLVSASLALASLLWILAALLANFLPVALTTFWVAFLSAALAFAILALIAAFFAGGADLRAFLRVTTFFAALSWAFNAAFVSGSLALASFCLIEAILALRTFDFF